MQYQQKDHSSRRLSDQVQLSGNYSFMLNREGYSSSSFRISGLSKSGRDSSSSPLRKRSSTSDSSSSSSSSETTMLLYSFLELLPNTTCFGGTPLEFVQAGHSRPSISFDSPVYSTKRPLSLKKSKTYRSFWFLRKIISSSTATSMVEEPVPISNRVNSSSFSQLSVAR